jgi:hypothetical protein
VERLDLSTLYEVEKEKQELDALSIEDMLKKIDEKIE